MTARRNRHYRRSRKCGLLQESATTAGFRPCAHELRTRFLYMHAHRRPLLRLGFVHSALSVSARRQ